MFKSIIISNGKLELYHSDFQITLNTNAKDKHSICDIFASLIPEYKLRKLNVSRHLAQAYIHLLIRREDIKYDYIKHHMYGINAFMNDRYPYCHYNKYNNCINKQLRQMIYRLSSKIIY